MNSPTPQKVGISQNGFDHSRPTSRPGAPVPPPGAPAAPRRPRPPGAPGRRRGGESAGGPAAGLGGSSSPEELRSQVARRELKKKGKGEEKKQAIPPTPELLFSEFPSSHRTCYPPTPDVVLEFQFASKALVQGCGRVSLGIQAPTAMPGENDRSMVAVWLVRPDCGCLQNRDQFQQLISSVAQVLITRSLSCLARCVDPLGLAAHTCAWVKNTYPTWNPAKWQT